MNTQPIEVEPQAVIETLPAHPMVRLTQRDIDTLVAVGAIPKGTPPDVIEFFSRCCAESRLSPFKRQIHIIKRWSKDGDRYTIQTGIDGYRARADRTNLYAGNDEYRFDEGITEYEMVKQNRKPPITATATVYKAVAGTRCPFTATARWEEYYPGEKQGFMWDKMPFLMLGKCAEALALRKAFPDELAGIYTDEEMAQADRKPLKEATPPQTAKPLVNVAPAGNQGSKQAAPVVNVAQDDGDREVLLKALYKLVPESMRADVAKYLCDFKGEDGRSFHWLLPTESLEDLPTDRLRKLVNSWSDGFAPRIDAWILENDQVPGAEVDPGVDYKGVPKDESKAELLAEQEFAISKAKPGEPEGWRDIIVPFGKQAGKRFGELAKGDLWWWCVKWEPKGREYKGKWYEPKPEDLELRDALNKVRDVYDFKDNKA